MSVDGAVVKILLAPESKRSASNGAIKVFSSPTVLCNQLMQLLGNLDYL